MIEKTIKLKDKGLSKEDRELMRRGQELADKYGLKFNGWWEVAYTFTIPDTKDTFLANTEKEIVNKLRMYRQYSESYLQEMPWTVFHGEPYDFKMEIPGWHKRLLAKIRDIENKRGTEGVEEFLESLEGIFEKPMFQKKFRSLEDVDRRMFANSMNKFMPGFLEMMEV